MSFPFTPNLHDAKIESLETQHEFLNLLRLRHLNWMNSADNPAIKDDHFQIAELLETVNDHYTRLLGELRAPLPTPTVPVGAPALAQHPESANTPAIQE